VGQDSETIQLICPSEKQNIFSEGAGQDPKSSDRAFREIAARRAIARSYILCLPRRSEVISASSKTAFVTRPDITESPTARLQPETGNLLTAKIRIR
jgi:hypothetical protein